MNDLEKFFFANNGRKINKWRHYFEAYDRHLARFRGTDVHVLEIGVYQGGSLQMWRDYFGPHAVIFGVDINPLCKQFEEENTHIFVGDQEDRRFLQGLTKSIPRVDVLIDDGGHSMKQQIATFDELFKHVSENGVYLCEDTHTSYWKNYGGGYRRRGTFMEYSKGLIDQLNAWHSEIAHKFKVDNFTRTTRSMHFYDSMVILEKDTIAKPESLTTGYDQIDNYQSPNDLCSKAKRWLNRNF
jgi:Methyltransferase domain